MIEARNLTKFFGENKVVDDVCFTVKKGEILGFLGPNGAGKSTTMRMIIGFLPKSSGSASIGGFDVDEQPMEARRLLGYLPENAPVYRDMTVIGFLDFIARIRGFSGPDKQKILDSTLEKAFLGEVRNQSVGTLSKGYKQRVCFAQAILHDPDYLILDEPTDGLDPNQKHEVRTLIRQMGRDKAIILSTHILEEVDAVCSRAIIISRGKIVADDTPAGLRTRSAIHGAVSVRVAGAEEARVLEAAQNIPGVGRAEVLERNKGGQLFRLYPQEPGADLSKDVMDGLGGSFSLESLTVEQGRLDEVFRRITA